MKCQKFKIFHIATLSSREKILNKIFNKIVILILPITLIAACSTTPPRARDISTTRNYLSNNVHIGGGESKSERKLLADSVCKNKLGSLFRAQDTSGYIGEKKIDGDRLTVQFFTCNVVPQENITGLALKAMQTRKFKTTPDVLVDSLRTFAQDRNGQCASWGEHKFVEYTTPARSTSKNEVDCVMPYSSTMLIFQRIIASYVYADGYTTLRVRIYIPRTSQITEGAVYSEFFKHIADQLFIDAIELSPMEMR